jgi:hypothetical protein
VRERDRAPTEGLNNEQEEKRNAPEHGLFHRSIILITLPQSGSFSTRGPATARESLICKHLSPYDSSVNASREISGTNRTPPA